MFAPLINRLCTGAGADVHALFVRDGVRSE